MGEPLGYETPHPSEVPGRGIRLPTSVRPTGLTQGKLVLRGRWFFGLRPQIDTHQSWGGAIVGYLVFWDMWCDFCKPRAMEDI